jgi:hypothetical protein
MQLFTPVKHLPEEIATELGQLVPLWTFLYWQFVNLACLLLEIDHKQARTVLREPRIDEYVSSIEDLCALKNIKIPKNFSDLKITFTKFEQSRNLYTHGLWLWDASRKQIYVRLTKGSHGQRISPKPKHKSRRLTPEAVPVTADTIHRLRRDIDKAISTVGDATREIESQLREGNKRT